MKDSTEGGLPRTVKEMLFSILDAVTGESTGAQAHARAAVAAGLTPAELAEGYAIAVMVTGITTMCKGGADSIRAAEEEQKERQCG
jgi:alkylhydroperoxidase/carboxymuconolactone decarboxylase family protein YurZ